MVMESKSNVIVMVTNLTEGGKLKCHQYWPAEAGQRSRIGDIVVENVSEKVEPLVRRVASLHLPTRLF
jgi:protein tyrosine phosphatase